MGVDYSIAHAADLAACLPSESNCGIAENPVNEWTIDKQLLALIEFWAHSWVWAHTKDAKRKQNIPKLRIPQPEGEKAYTGDAIQMTVDEMTDFLESLKDGMKGGDDG